MAANRSEIAIRIFRAADELGLRTVAVYSYEDRLSLHRFKADEAYMIGQGKGPVQAYLDVDGVVGLAKEKNVDAVHPGYGFLSENPALARACREAGITFVGPSPEILEQLGDKTVARRLAEQAGVAVLPGSASVKSNEEARRIAEELGYPVIVNAATVEFLLDIDQGEFYFIEVNPRIQVEHTVTEQVTGIDVVECQILIAQGRSLDDPLMRLGSQAAIRTAGYALQCRVTTEDPAN